MPRFQRVKKQYQKTERIGNMGLQIFKPNKANTGGAAHVSFSAKSGQKNAAYVEFIKQNGWDAAARNGQGNGKFSGGAKTVIKLSTTEVATIIDAVERREDAPAFFHTSPDGSAQIKFVRYAGKVKNAQGQYETSKTPTGYSLSVSKGEDRYGITFTFGEARELSEYLKFALDKIFGAIYATDKEKAKEYAERKEKENKAPTPQKSKSVSDFVQDQPEESEETSVGGDDDSDSLPF